MKKQTLRLLLAMGAAVLFSGCATCHQSQAYDYKIISGRVQDIGRTGQIPLGKQLEQATAEGWQVVTATDAGEGDGALIILKRRK